ncbi:uncharacterized protein TNCT_158691 [Trichonephila clavata]|uniref:Gustatory receptor n=1 Tax=Trichonephila clavata TaxID=2740835 RepID=A0A8X6KG57_TRICU|nr:uncharacterized protein TNCT_158691 [Trichonephila clavata]
MEMEYSRNFKINDISYTRIRSRKSKHPFHLILKSFWLFGLHLEGYNDTTLIFNVFFKIWTVIIIFCYHSWIVFDVIWYFNHRVHENALAESVTVWASTITFDFLIWKRKDIRKLMEVVKTETLKLNEKTRKKHEKKILIVVVSVWLYVMIFVVQNLVFCVEKEYSKQHTSSIIGYASQGLSPSEQIAYYRLNGCLQSFFIQGLLTMTIALYLLLCLTCKKWFQHLKKQYSNTERLSSLSETERFCSRFDELSKNVHLLDQVFSLPVAVWLLMILVTLCVRIVLILNPLLPNTNQMITATVLSFSRAATALVGMSFIADSVHKKAMITLFQLDSFPKVGKDALSNAMYQEIHMAFTRFAFNPTQLTFLKIARLNRRFLMTCIGMMSTYVIISIQLYPNAKRGLGSI